MVSSFPQSFAASNDVVADGPLGQRAHADLLAHTPRLERKLWSVAPGVWCLVGNGLSNQTFVEGPEGLIVIDTGESVQEMSAALAEMRAHTDAPVAAVMYSHFHYVGGTQVLVDENPNVPVWGHERIVANRQRYGFELGAVAGRGLIHQFGMSLPAEGPDAIANVGLGLSFRDAIHAPFTEGFVAPTNTVAEPVVTSIAGLEVHITPAPSDADDNVTIWFPTLGVCVNNMVWPTLFNVFAIRGEEFRDPRVLLTGLDHIGSLGADHLVGSHGPPISGADTIAAEVVSYRDSIQFMFDQTVRGINLGLTMDELTEFVQLPNHFSDSYLTTQFYGLVEHHVRQIFTGLRGWFDGNEASLFPVEHTTRYAKLIAGFGGADEVRKHAQQAADGNDLRWALELATWLVRCETNDLGRADGGTDEDRALLAGLLRSIAQRTTGSNARNWCLTRALELEGSLDLSRHRVHRLGAGAVLANPVESSVSALRVLLVPDRISQPAEMRWVFDEGDVTGLVLRNGVAVATSGSEAGLEIALDKPTWAQLLGRKLSLEDALAAGSVRTEDPAAVQEFFACFDHPSFAE